MFVHKRYIKYLVVFRQFKSSNDLNSRIFSSLSLFIASLEFYLNFRHNSLIWKKWFYLCQFCLLLAIVVKGDPKTHFSIATTPRSRRERNSFPGLHHFTLDLYLIMLSAKQEGIKYHFWVFGMIWPGYPEPLANTQTIRPMAILKQVKKKLPPVYLPFSRLISLTFLNFFLLVCIFQLSIKSGVEAGKNDLPEKTRENRKNG